jgi:hypothetical protein
MRVSLRLLASLGVIYSFCCRRWQMGLMLLERKQTSGDSPSHVTSPLPLTHASAGVCGLAFLLQ